jgi:hypothetical protein
VRHHGFDPHPILNGAPVCKAFANEMIDLVSADDAACQPDRIGQKNDPPVEDHQPWLVVGTRAVDRLFELEAATIDARSVFDHPGEPGVPDSGERIADVGADAILELADEAGCITPTAGVGPLDCFMNLGIHQRIERAKRILERAAAAGEIVSFVREGSRGDSEIQNDDAHDHAAAQASPHAAIYFK